MKLIQALMINSVWADTLTRATRRNIIGSKSPHGPFKTQDVHVPTNGKAAIWHDVGPADMPQLNLQLDNNAVYLFANNTTGCWDGLRATWEALTPQVSGMDVFTRESACGQLRLGLKLNVHEMALAGHARASTMVDGLEVMTYWHAANV